MYSDEIKQTKNYEIDLHPISKWKRILLYLGDMLITFILGVILMNVAVMPLYSLFNSANTKLSYQAEHIRDDILYENKLLYWHDDNLRSAPQYDFDKDLVYTYRRFLAYYVIDDTTPLDSRIPEYVHIEENEVIKTYYVTIRSDEATYLDIFAKHNNEKKYFNIEGSSITLKSDIKNELKPFFMPNDNLGSKGKTYYNNLSDIFSALYGMVIKDVYAKDLTDSSGHSFVEYQKIIRQISENYYKAVTICSIISYVLSFSVTRLVYPLVNRYGHSITGSIMKVDRIGFRNLAPISKGEVALTSAYHFLFDLPGIMFLSLSYTTLIYSFRVPLLPILSIIGAAIALISLFFILFNPFNRSLIDLFSQTVMVSSDEVDGIIKAKETLLELKASQQKDEK